MMRDVLTVGESMLRYWVPAGERIESAPQFQVGVAGAEANVSVALARMGRSVTWISRLPDNPLGHRTARALSAQGVDVSQVIWSPAGRMGTYYVELSAPPRPATVVYDRAGSAASTMTTEDVDWSLLDDTSVAYVSGITPALSGSCREVTYELMERAGKAGVPAVFDVNYRARLWEVDEAARVLGDLSNKADVVIVTEEDARDLFSVAGDPASVLNGMSRVAGTDRVVLTRGAAGASWKDGGAAGHIPPHPAAVIDPIGAGDAFAAGVIIGLLDGSLPEGVALGAAMGAIEVGLFGDTFTVDPAEVANLLKGTDRDVSR
jgi:2-dehydro-3-deoxygluconokinase